MESQQSGESLLDVISRRVLASGPITVAEMMQIALYHPRLGYYSKGPAIGPRGDFTTSPEASPAFARLLARHVSEIDGLLGHPAPFHLVECGPGLGTLPLGVLDTLKSAHPSLYERLRYWLVEVSPALIARQRERLLPEHEGVADWKGSLDEMPMGLSGALLANEFVDALPVHVLENRQGDILEQYVAAGEQGLHFVYDSPSSPDLLGFLRRYNITLEPGQRVEINLAASDWIRHMGAVFERGVATIIDYGDTAPARYSEQRKEGTLLAYYQGKVSPDILAHPGEQDITALVDFTALQDEAIACDFQVVGLTRQAPFLVGLGLGTDEPTQGRGDDLPGAMEDRRGMHALVSMQGLGQFHVLVLGKGVDSEVARQRLSGLRYAHLLG